MKKCIRPVLFIFLGFVAGVLLVCHLSMRASNIYIETLHLEYELEQQILAAQAKSEGNMEAAIRHYENVRTSATNTLASFNKIKKGWTLSYPIDMIFFRAIAKSMVEDLTLSEIRMQEAKRNDGLYLAMTADALERMGRTEEAQAKYIEASVLLGYENDIDRVKKWVKFTTESEDKYYVKKKELSKDTSE